MRSFHSLLFLFRFNYICSYFLPFLFMLWSVYLPIYGSTFLKEVLLAHTNSSDLQNAWVELFSPLHIISLFWAAMLCDRWFPAGVINSLVTKVLKLVSTAVSLLISRVVAEWDMRVCECVCVCIGLVNTAINLRVSWKARNFITTCSTHSFSSGLRSVQLVAFKPY
jgi:hypothetical protein